MRVTPLSEVSVVPEINVHFDERETMPDRLAEQASQFGITVEQLIKRYVSEGINRDYPPVEQTIAANTLDDFFVVNGVLKPKN